MKPNALLIDLLEEMIHTADRIEEHKTFISLNGHRIPKAKELASTLALIERSLKNVIWQVSGGDEHATVEELYERSKPKIKDYQ